MEKQVASLVAGTLSSMAAIPLGKSVIKYYRSCFNAITRYCDSKHVKEYTIDTVDAFVAYQKRRHALGEIKSVFLSAQEKAARLLLEYKETEGLEWKYRRKKQASLCICFEDVLSSLKFSLEKTLAKGSVELLEVNIRQLLRHFESEGHSDFSAVGENDIRGFLAAVGPNHRGHMGNVVWSVKKLFAHLNGMGLSDFDAERMLCYSVPRRKKALPCFTREESEAVFGCVDRGTACGKRDYAIMQLAITTGLRGVDILSLHLCDFDWRRNELTTIQSKTGKPICLPIIPAAGNAVADYILNARPQSEEPFVFLRVRRPHSRLGGAAGPNIMSRYLERAGLSHLAYDGKSFHAFRRTAGTRMIEARIDLATVSQVLGHASPNSSKRYISLDEASLAECCMPLGNLSSTREGLL
jgi:integrase